MTKVLDSQDWAHFLERARREHGSSWWTVYDVMMTSPWKEVSFRRGQLNLYLGRSASQSIWTKDLLVQKKSGGLWCVLNREEAASRGRKSRRKC